MAQFGSIGKFKLLILLLLPTFNVLHSQQVIDSIVTFGYYTNGDSIRTIKFDYEYNEAWQQTAYTFYGWNPLTNCWEGSIIPCESCVSSDGREEYEYDQQGLLTLTKTFEWSVTSLRWEITSKSEHSYDLNRHKTSYNLYMWDRSLNGWSHYFQMDFGYDDSGNTISRFDYQWLAESNSWLHLSHYEWEYEQNGSKTAEIRFKWNNSSEEWLNFKRKEWTYDSTGRLKELSTYQWTQTGEGFTWNPTELIKYTNESDTFGNIILAIQADWISDHWRILQREEYTYNSMGQMVLHVLKKLKGGTLEEYIRSEREYDINGNLIHETSTGMMARVAGHVLPEKYKVIRTFDHYGNISFAKWNWWNPNSQTFDPNGIDYYYYHPSSNGKSVIDLPGISLFPNPVNDILFFEGLDRPIDIRIYSMQGNLVYHMGQGDNSVNLSGLAPGSYLVLVLQEGRLPYRNIIVKN
jgi:hypothetical protein